MRIKHIIRLLLVLSIVSCTKSPSKEIYKSDNLIVEQITDNTFVHISYLQTQDFGKVACNGMVYINDDEAMIFDTPTDNTTSKELIEWLEKTKKVIVKGVVVTHFHDDCLGGLEEFHENNISSYASEKTIKMVQEQNLENPKITLDLDNDLEIKGKPILNLYFGEGHTKDNIVSYIPSEKILFGGCLIKTDGAKKGYLGDANVTEWSNTVLELKKELSDVEYVIPGHGKIGGPELLTYTIDLFN